MSGEGEARWNHEWLLVKPGGRLMEDCSTRLNQPENIDIFDLFGLQKWQFHLVSSHIQIYPQCSSLLPSWLHLVESQTNN